MVTKRTDLADFSYFLAIARHRSFRRAGLEIGVSASALSHALKGLEARIGVRLINRTNRSVTLTAAGEELFAALKAPFEAIELAVKALNRHRGDPVGRIRINVMQHASGLLLAPVLPVLDDGKDSCGILTQKPVTQVLSLVVGVRQQRISLANSSDPSGRASAT